MKVKKIISFLCAMIILFSTLAPNISLAATELSNTIENIVTVVNEETDENTITNKIENVLTEDENIISNTTNEITNTIQETNEIKETTEIQPEEKEKTNEILEETLDNEIEKEEIIETQEEPIIEDMEDAVENVIAFDNGISLYSVERTQLYVVQMASYISTTVHNRADGYGILVRKAATNSNYSDVKQVFCIEMRSRIKFSVFIVVQ